MRRTVHARHRLRFEPFAGQFSSVGSHINDFRSPHRPPPNLNLAKPKPLSLSIAAPATTATTTTTIAPTTTLPDLSWTLLAGGDVLMDRSEAADIDPFVGIEPALATADIALINVEMVISDRGKPANKTFVFRAPPSAAERIAAAGVDVANLANNHAMDYGADALLDTINHLQARGVVALGAGATSTDAYRHQVIEVRPGVRVAFVGASAVVPHGFPLLRHGRASHRRTSETRYLRASAQPPKMPTWWSPWFIGALSAGPARTAASATSQQHS